MTTGTAGNDQLSNDPSKADTVLGLGGDDTITIVRPAGFVGSVTVDGGDGYDILIADMTDLTPTEIHKRWDSIQTVTVSYSNIEELRLTGSLFFTQLLNAPANTKDILTLSASFAQNYVINTYGGNDQIFFTSNQNSGGSITVDGGDGDDLIDFTNSSTSPGVAVIGIGGNGNDTLIGSAQTNRADDLRGGAGDDVIDGRGGADVMTGGTGNDVYYVDVAGDTIVENAGEGTDEVRTALAAYTLGANLENLTGLSAGSQTLTGNTLDNVITVSTGTTTVNGVSGVDRLFIDASASASAVTLSALTPGADGYSGTASWSTGSTSFQNIDAITIKSSTGNYQDVITTGNGDDVFYHYGINDASYLMDIVDLAGGNDLGVADFSAVTGFQVTSQLLGNGHFLYLVGGAGKLDLANVERVDITGGALADTFTGFGGDDVLRGGGGNDTLAGGAGADRIDGGAGDDTLSGEDGNDIITVSSGIDNVNGGADTDTLVVDYSASTNGISGGSNIGYLNDGVPTLQVAFTSIERFDITTGSGNDNIVTGAGDDIVRLNAGSDFVNVGTGNDTADGGAGTDGISADLSAASGAIAWDLAANTYSGPFGSFVNFKYFGTVFTGSGNDTIVTGAGSHDETINAGDGDDSIKVSGGTDNVNGGAGTNDRLVVDYSASANGIVGGSSSGYINDGSSSLQVAFSGIERFDISSGSGNDNLTTGAGDDVIHLNGGNDFVNVGTGNDTADGGAGTDGISADLSAASGAIAWNLVANTYSGAVGSFTNFEYFGTLYTGSGNDTIVTGAGNHDETVNSGDGNDSIKVFGGNDNVNGGAGTGDRLVVDYSDSVNAIIGGSNTGYLTDGNLGHQVVFSGIEVFDVTSGGANDNIVTGAGDDVVHANGGADQVDVGSGNDSADGGAGIDRISADLSAASGAIAWDLAANTYSGPFGSFVNFEYFGTVFTGSGNDTIVSGLGNHDENINGGDGDDTIKVFGGNDNVNGGAGSNDKLIADYSDSVNAIVGGLGSGYFSDGGVGHQVVFSGIELFDVTGGANNDNLTGGGGNDRFLGNDGADVLTGAGGDDWLDGGAGADTMAGGTGNDVYVVDSLSDVVTENAGEGSADEIRTMLNTYVLAAANVENLSFGGAGDADLRGNSGDNVVTGGAGNDFLRLQDGGADTAVGGNGNDAFYFGAAFTAADRVDGGAGNDVLGLQGDYSGGLALDPASFTGIETLSLLTHSDNRFGGDSASLFSYDLTMADDNVAAGQRLTVNASTLEAGENLSVDGHLETDGSFFIYGGKGADDLTGGTGADVFFFAEDGRFAASDHVDGQGGSDIMVLRGDYTLVLTGTSLVNVDTVTLMSGADARFYPAGTSFHYDITTADSTVAAGVTMTFNGGDLGVGETLSFDGSQESDGNFRLWGGKADDTITGGAGHDLLFGGLGFDVLTGGAGNDVFRYQNAGESTASSQDFIQDFTSGDIIDLSRVDADVNQAGDQAFSFIGSNAFSHQAGELRFEASNLAGYWTVQADVDGDGVADLQMQVHLTDSATHNIGANDFLL